MRTNRLADALQRQVVRHGDRVAMLALNSVAVMEVYFAVAKLGTLSVPINFRLTLAEVNYLLADSGASFVFQSIPFASVIGRRPVPRKSAFCAPSPSP